MKTISGVYTSAIIYNTDTTEYSIDSYALAQLKQLCDNKTFEGCKIRENVPSGFQVRKTPCRKAQDFDLTALRCFKHINAAKALISLGTLGGGNHFIELDQGANGDTYLIIHSGSRHLGKEVTEYYLQEGQKYLKSNGTSIPYEPTWLEGNMMQDYLHDLSVVQAFAAVNREIMIDEITKGMKWKILDSYSCSHNYVDFDVEVPVIRKGAISAKAGEPVIIPVNMRDGVILGTGLGNEEWNCSAPHGAGRILKREDVKVHFTVSQFKKEMAGIYTSCINHDTLDEAPFAYRDIESIRKAITDTVAVEQIIRPIYNFKAGGN